MQQPRTLQQPVVMDVWSKPPPTPQEHGPYNRGRDGVAPPDAMYPGHKMQLPVCAARAKATHCKDRDTGHLRFRVANHAHHQERSWICMKQRATATQRCMITKTALWRRRFVFDDMQETWLEDTVATDGCHVRSHWSFTRHGATQVCKWLTYCFFNARSKGIAVFITVDPCV